MVFKPYDPDTMLFQQHLAAEFVLLDGVVVHFAVKFDGQMLLRTIEIKYIISDTELATEKQPFYLPPFQPLPEPHLRHGAVVAQLPPIRLHIVQVVVPLWHNLL